MIGNSSIVKMTVLIPVIGYMVIFNDYLVDYFQISRHLFEPTYVQRSGGATIVSWRLLFIYFGLCSLGIGSAIYQFCCPETIKQFATSIDFIGATRSHMGDVMLARLEGRLNADPLSSECPASAPMRQKWRVEEGRICGPS